jgi:WD40 repeat protein
VDVWDLANPDAKRPLFPKRAHTIADLWVSPDGQDVLAGELYDGTVSQYWLPTGAPGPVFSLDLTTNTLAPPRLLPDGSGVVCGRVPTLWKFGTDAQVAWRAGVRLSDSDDATAFAVAPDCQQLAVGEQTRLSASYHVCMYRMGAAEVPREFGTVSKPVRRLAWSPGGEYLAAAVDTRVFVWTADGAEATEYRIPGRKHVIDIAFHPSGRYLAVADNAGTVRLLETGAWAEARTFQWGLPKARCVCFSPDGTLAAVGSDSGKVVVWDVDL